MALSSNENQFQLSLDETTQGVEEPSLTGTPHAEKPELFLLDGMALVYRAFFALQRADMRTKDGVPTGAAFGFLTTLLKIYETYAPDYLAVAFDSREKTFRHERYEAYKANRPQPPEDLITQLDFIFRLIEAFNIPILKQPGYEADDLIGTAAHEFEPECRINIVSPDKDMTQLIHGGVTLLKPGKRQNELLRFGAAELKEELGIAPDQFIDLLTLTGDSSDNIPGAKGIGPKTASKMLLSYGSLDEITKNLEKLPPRTRKSLEEFLPERELIRDLVTIRTDIDLQTPLESLQCGQPDPEKLFPLLERLELRAIASKIPGLFPAITPPKEIAPDNAPKVKKEAHRAPTVTEPPEDADYTLINTEKELTTLTETLAGLASFAIDTETTSLNTFEAELVGISISFNPQEAFFIYCSPEGLKAEKALSILKPVLENPTIEKWGQNLKYDILVLKNYGIQLAPTGFDTMLASYVINPEETHNLDDLAQRHLQYQTTTYSELCGTGKKAVPLRQVPLEALKNYACQDADIALRLQNTLGEQLKDNQELEWLCRNIEFPLVNVLAAMEYRGVSLDTEHLEKTATKVASLTADLKERIYATAGSTFNIDSPKQLGEILFTRLGLPAKKTTKTGYSTNVQVLEELAMMHPIAQDILEYRSLQKLRSTYIEALPKILNPATGKLHTSFNQHITATGRLSSSNPNLQNIPIRTELGKEIRKAFIASTSRNFLLSADYSQIELRIAAEISGDEKLIEAFRNQEDIHAATAKVIFDTEDVTSDMRRKAKEVNFGVLYGIQPYGLSMRLNISQKEAKAIIDTYKSKYPGLFDALDALVRQAAENGFVTTLLGRRRYIAALNSRNGNIRKAAERAAMNTPVQGTAADIIKYAMCLIENNMQEHKMHSTMLLQVHDELVFETNEEEHEKLETMVVASMKEAALVCGLKQVPVEVDTGIGKNWLEAH